jgi:catechol 2,3-dioxygenase-like lactoylglutathione lyase family enzyme
MGLIEGNRVEVVNNFYARSVFFVKDAERSLKFYTETLGFSLEWNHQEQGRAFVFIRAGEKAPNVEVV